MSETRAQTTEPSPCLCEYAISAPESAYQYDANNRLTAYNGQSISYDADGNMQNAFIDCEEYGFVFDSANRLLKAKGQEYTYNAEDVRIRNKCSNYTDTYVYDTNCKLSRMLIRNTNGGIAKFVYGVGLIGEESYNTYKVYHFDSRGSTVALTDMTGAVIDTYSYNTYGKITYRTYSNDTVLLYNGRDGVAFRTQGTVLCVVKGLVIQTIYQQASIIIILQVRVSIMEKSIKGASLQKLILNNNYKENDDEK